MIDGCPDPYRLIFTLMYSMGLKVGEAVNLKLQDYDQNLKSLKVENRSLGQSRDLKIPAIHRLDFSNQYNKVLREQGKESFLFPSPLKKHSPIHSSTVHKILKKQLAYYGLSSWTSCMSLRHNCAINALKTGTNIIELKQFLGHQCIKSTLLYRQIVNNKRPKDHPLDQLVSQLKKPQSILEKIGSSLNLYRDPIETSLKKLLAQLQNNNQQGEGVYFTNSYSTWLQWMNKSQQSDSQTLIHHQQYFEDLSLSFQKVQLLLSKAPRSKRDYSFMNLNDILSALNPLPLLLQILNRTKKALFIYHPPA